MSTGFELAAQIRSTTGKAEARRMRHDGKVPGIIYGAGKEPEMITLPHDDILHALEHEAFYSHILNIKLDNGKTEDVVLKNVQRHVYKPKIEHVDFFRVKATEKLTMHIPIHYLGEAEAPGVVDAGGVVSKLMTDIEVKCLPKDLPEFIEVDISKLEMDQALHITDIKLPKGVELLHEIDEEHDHPIVSVHQPKVIKEDVDAEVAAEEEAKAEAEAAEGEAPAEEAQDAEAAEGEGEAPAEGEAAEAKKDDSAEGEQKDKSSE
jgi:large subunit ribosomal protein L25